MNGHLSVDPKLAQGLTTGILGLYSRYADLTVKPEKTEIEEFFEPHIQISSNERVICRNSKELVERLHQLQRKYRQITYSKPLENLITSGNKVVLRYNVNLVDQKRERSRFYILAILTVEEKRVLHWTEILHKQDSGSWEF
jgi:glutaredoxin-related protein